MSTFIFPHCLESGPYTDWPVAVGGFNGDGLLTYVGPDGTPLPSLHLENFRDGLEDYAYAKLLEEKLREMEPEGQGNEVDTLSLDVCRW